MPVDDYLGIAKWNASVVEGARLGRIPGGNNTALLPAAFAAGNGCPYNLRFTSNAALFH
jgi:hypothetical protein